MIAYKVDYEYKNDIDLLDIIMSLYSKTVLNEELTQTERTVLREYIVNGYSAQTKKSLCINLSIKATYLNVLNHNLQNKKFLRPHPNNQRLKVLNEDLVTLQKCFMGEDEKKAFIVNFTKASR